MLFYHELFRRTIISNIVAQSSPKNPYKAHKYEFCRDLPIYLFKLLCGLRFIARKAYN